MTMAAKVLYTKKRTDPPTIVWPTSGPASEKYTFTDGTPQMVPHLIGYGDGTLTYPDGRSFPQITSLGSTFIHQK
jgi:hypothetical protein